MVSTHADESSVAERLRNKKATYSDDKTSNGEAAEDNEVESPLEQQDFCAGDNLDEPWETHSPGAVRVIGLYGSSASASTPISWFHNDAENDEQRESEILSAAVIEDEDEIRARVQARIEDRIRKNSITAQDVHVVKATNTLNSSERQERQRHTLWFVFIFAIVSLSVVAGVTLLDSRSRGGDGNFGDGGSIGTPPPLPPVANLVDLRSIVESISDPSLLSNTSTSQYLAIEWLIDDDMYFRQLPANWVDVDTKQYIIERYVMAVLYYSTGGDAWILDLNFLSNHSICEWNLKNRSGVACDSDGFVKGIGFDFVGLNGTIPSELSALDSLETFSVVQNFDLVGTLPQEFERLRNLEFFQLHGTGVTGPIPNSWSNIRKLSVLALYDCQLTGSIPSRMFQSSNLEEVTFGFNSLTGTVPEFSSDTANLRRVVLCPNFLEGPIPASIYHHTELFKLGVGDCSFSMRLQSEIGLLSNLETFGFSNNENIFGTLPTEIGLLTDLTHFYGYKNALVGPIPSEIGLMERLEIFVVDGNNLTGTMPSEIGLLSRLAGFSLGFNQVSGTIPPSFLMLPATVALNFRNTSLESNAFDFFCDRFVGEDVPFVSADCLGDDPEVQCPCCSECCDKHGNCHFDIPKLCNKTARRWETKLDRGLVCECQDGGYTMSCTETCQSCNEDKSICGFNTGFGFTVDDAGISNSTWSTFRYVAGGELNSTTVLFESSSSDEKDCTVSINGEQCHECTRVTCKNNGVTGVSVLCDNIDGVGSYSPCSDYDDGSGVLNIFAYQDPTLRSGCDPIFIEMATFY